MTTPTFICAYIARDPRVEWLDTAPRRHEPPRQEKKVKGRLRQTTVGSTTHTHQTSCVLVRGPDGDGTRVFMEPREQLKTLLLDNVEDTGVELGKGSYGVVQKLLVHGLK